MPYIFYQKNKKDSGKNPIVLIHNEATEEIIAENTRHGLGCAEIEAMPPKEPVAGKKSLPYYNSETSEIWYDYSVDTEEMAIAKEQARIQAEANTKVRELETRIAQLEGK